MSELEREIASLQAELDRALAERDALEGEVEKLRAQAHVRSTAARDAQHQSRPHGPRCSQLRAIG